MLVKKKCAWYRSPLSTENRASISRSDGGDGAESRKQAKRLAVTAKLRLMAGRDRLRRSDREIGVPFGVMKFTIAISRKAAPRTVTNNTLGSVSNSIVTTTIRRGTFQVF